MEGSILSWTSMSNLEASPESIVIAVSTTRIGSALIGRTGNQINVWFFHTSIIQNSPLMFPAT